MAKSHPIVGKSPVSATSDTPESKTNNDEGATPNNGWAEWTPARLRQTRSHVPPPNEDDSDNDESEEEVEHARESVRGVDRQLAIMRRVFRKWRRFAGVRGDAADGTDEVVEGDLGGASWTRAIAPRVEGRIRMVTAEESK